MGDGLAAKARGFLFAFACLAALSGCNESSKPSADTGAFDTARLPRVNGAKEIFASPATTIFVSPNPIGPTADTLDKALAAAGWQRYVAPNTAYREDPSMRTMTLKKGQQALNVFITVAPAQNNAISVQYSGLPLKTDLPFIKGASNIEYSPDRPLLTLVTAEPVDKALDFYRKEMADRGWFLWSEKTNAKQAPGGSSGTIHERGGYAHYITDKDPSSTLVLTLQKAGADKYKLEIKQWPAAVLETAHRAYLNRDNSAPLADVAKLPRLPGAKETARSTPDEPSYSVSGNIASTTTAIKALLAADGWKPYVAPLDEPHSTWLTFKKGPQGLSVHYTISPGTNEATTDQTTVRYSPTRLQYAPPVPDDATDIVFDENRPYLSLISGGTVDSLRSFYNKELLAAEWTPLTAADAAAKWPTAKFDDKPANGDVAYYVRGDKRAIMLTLRTRDGGKTSAEIKVPSFAQAQTVTADKDIFGLPIPNPHKTAGGTGGNVKREVHAHVMADIGAVLAFYRRELAARNWKEETQGAVVTADEVVLTFKPPEGTAVLKIGRKYDLSVVSLVHQLPKEVATAAPPKGDSMADMLKEAQQMMRDADAMVGTKSPRVAQNDAVQTLRPLAGSNAPVPVPEGAEDVEFEDGKLEFSSDANVKSVAEFYRSIMKQQGWGTQSSVINNPNMVVLNFSKAGKSVSFTVMKMGNKTNVSADGSALEVAAAPGAAPADKTAADTPAPAATEDDLIAEESGGLPVPKRHTMSEGTKTPFRRELKTNVPLNLADVLGFYRREFGKLNWKEEAKGAVIAADSAAITFTTPTGPALLKLGRKDGETTVHVMVKDPSAAEKAGILPKPGQVKIMFGNINGTEGTITFNNKPIKVAAGAGTKAPDGPALDLPPGKYKYSIRLPGRPAKNDEIEVGADEIWGLMIGPGGVLALQAY